MTIDNIRPPGSWREEILRGPATISQLRDIISELEQALRESKSQNDRLKEHNSKLMSELVEAVAKEMEARATVARLRKEITDVWTALKEV